jgi:hypothetical protein
MGDSGAAGGAGFGFRAVRGFLVIGFFVARDFRGFFAISNTPVQ